MNKALKSVWRFMRSRKLAIVLIIIITIAVTIGILVPQKRMDSATYQQWMSENPELIAIINRLNLNHLFDSRWFIGLGIIFLINLTACTIEQIGLTIRRWKGFNDFDLDIKGLKKTKEYQVDESLIFVREKVVDKLKQKRYKIEDVQDGLIAVKSKWGLWGSVICHIGLIMIILGFLSTLMFKMYGLAYIAEGQVFTEVHDQYRHLREAPFFNEDHLGFQATVKDQRIIYDGDILEMIEADLAIIENGRVVKEGTVNIGHPVVYDNVYFYFDRIGYAPLLTLIDKATGRTYLRSYAMFDTQFIGKNKERHYIDFIIPPANLKIKGEFYPDFIIEDGKYMSKTRMARNPVVDLEIYEEGQKIYDGLLKQGEPIQFNGMELTMGRIRGWTGFVVSRDPGNIPIFVGFVITLLGMTMIYLINPRRLKIELESKDNETKLYIYGQQNKYKSDLDRRINELIEEVIK